MNARLWLPVVIVLALSASLAACKGGPRLRPVSAGDVDTGAGSLTAARKFLEGRWSLESFEVFPPGGQPIRLTGMGTLVYDEFGNLKMDIRTDEKTASALTKAGIDIRNGVLSSDGRTVVDLQNRTLTYIIQGQPAPGVAAGPLAANRPRHWEVVGDVLTLTTKDAKGEALSVGRWKKEQ
jgi:hypothetical protein